VRGGVNRICAFGNVFSTLSLCWTCCWSRGGLVFPVSSGSGGSISSSMSLFWWSHAWCFGQSAFCSGSVRVLRGGGGCDGSEMGLNKNS
ncbi:hypothetical protein A2U01_0079791, partial [Trifolium medium]|nr:hypothetical protein [Trifolium medium]